jgi:hypothetical protein
MDGMRRSVALTLVTILVAGFAFLLLQAGAPAAQASDAAVTRLGWLGGCYPPVRAVGRYFPGDAPCRPSQTVSLEQIQAALSAHGVLRPDETLRYAPETRARALTCWGLVMERGQASGWVCSDEAGLYRVGMDGRLASGRWQLLSDGAWVEADA